MSNPQLIPLVAAGLSALRAGDRVKAREILSRAVSQPGVDATAWVAFAIVSDNPADRIGALQEALKLEPVNPIALIMRADQYRIDGDLRAATAFYAAAVRNAPQVMNPDIAMEVKRASEAVMELALQFENYLHEKTHNGGEVSDRFALSLEMVSGRKRIHTQKPRFYYFPGLPQIEFYSREQVPFLAAMEAATQDIKGELEEILRQDNAFEPYVQQWENRPLVSNVQGMLNNPAWSAFYLYKNGEIVAENAAHCPKTMEALKNVPLPIVKGREPSVLFSLLKPHTRIPPHHGFINTRLICHLPLIVPKDCFLRVGSDIQPVVEGKAWAFDDTMEHEAWNDSNETRVILLFEVWKPELSELERKNVTAMFEAIDAYGNGQAAGWDD